MNDQNATRAAGSSASDCWTIIRWFPCWAHVLCVFMQIEAGNYAAAWFAFAAAWFAFVWLAQSSNMMLCVTPGSEPVPGTLDD